MKLELLITQFSPVPSYSSFLGPNILLYLVLS